MNKDGRATHDRPQFLVTIDTEGDNLWARPRTISTHNSVFLPRFQTLCEAYSLKPTYLTNHEMAVCPAVVEFGRDILRRGTGEIGMHLHAWNSPPIVPLTRDDFEAQPYLVEYPLSVMREKIETLTGVLEDTFGQKMLSHRAGRWAFNGCYAKLLDDCGYAVDCSVTPHMAWSPPRSDPTGEESTDYTGCLERAYYVDLVDVRRAGTSRLLEVPVTIRRRRWPVVDGIRSLRSKNSLLQRALNWRFPSTVWLRPNGHNRGDLQWVLAKVVEEDCPFAEFMLHSSELMPGGSPTFHRSADIERLYEDLHCLFEVARDRFQAATLMQFAESSRRELHRDGAASLVAEQLGPTDSPEASNPTPAG
jgi:hypothetical protein